MASKHLHACKTIILQCFLLLHWFVWSTHVSCAGGKLFMMANTCLMNIFHTIHAKMQTLPCMQTHHIGITFLAQISLTPCQATFVSYNPCQDPNTSMYANTSYRNYVSCTDFTHPMPRSNVSYSPCQDANTSMYANTSYGNYCFLHRFHSLLCQGATTSAKTSSRSLLSQAQILSFTHAMQSCKHLHACKHII